MISFFNCKFVNGHSFNWKFVKAFVFQGSLLALFFFVLQENAFFSLMDELRDITDIKNIQKKILVT